MENYSFTEHLHNYAVWTAARAVQRNFTTTSNIKIAIEYVGLKEFVLADKPLTVPEFKLLHKEWALNIIESLKALGVSTATYGRAAKIISIYLKRSIILCNKAACDRSSIIHPPIDGILLKKISSVAELKDLKLHVGPNYPKKNTGNWSKG